MRERFAFRMKLSLQMNVRTTDSERKDEVSVGDERLLDDVDVDVESEEMDEVLFKSVFRVGAWCLVHGACYI